MNRRKRGTRILPQALQALVLLVLVAGAAQAQILGELRGYIRGQNGEALPGVTVTVVNQETGAERTAITQADGYYRVGSVPSGVYSVTAALEGMQTTRQENVPLLVGQVLDINLAMSVTAAEEVITVTAESPVVEVSRSSAANYLREVEIENIPIAGRDFKNFAILTPTVKDDPQRGFITMSGQRGIYSGLRLDGTSFKNAFFGYGQGGESTENDGLVIGQESVKEFQVITNGFNPEFGLDGGGFVNVVTKSGTNDWKGSGFAFYTDDGFAEDIPATPLEKLRDPNVQDRTPSEFERKNWGATLGGPIRQDKIHFFFSYDQSDRTSPFVERLNTRGAYDAILLRAQRDPAFADLVAGFEPNNDGIAAPDPIRGRTASGLFSRSVDNLILLGKVDFSPSPSHNASLRYNYTDYERTSTYLDEESLKLEDTDAFVASWVWVVNTRALNELRGQYATDDLTRGNSRVGSALEAQIRFRGRDGSATDEVGKFDFLPILADTTSYELRDSFSYLFGEHDLKFGIDYASDNMEQLFAGSLDGRYDFNTLADFLANRASLVRIYFGNVSFPNYDETQEVMAAFAQDSWRPSSRWTVNYGLRWEKTDNPSGLEHIFAEGRQIPDDDHVSPRVGFAWQVNENVGDVLRGGFGFFYGRTPTLLFASQIQENGIYPNYGRINVNPTQTGFVPLGTPIDNVNPPRTTRPATSYIDPSFEDAQNTRINLGYERPLNRNWSAGIDLLWADGENLQRNYDDNVTVTGLDAFGRPNYSRTRPQAAFDQIFVRRSDGNSEYQAATIKIARRFAGRYTFQAHYTYAKDEDDDSNERNATDITVSNILDPGYDWGLSDRDVKNRLVAVGVVKLPLGFFAGGTFIAQSGTPWTAVDANEFLPNCPAGNCPAARAVLNGELVGRNTHRNESWNQIDLRLGWEGNWSGRGSIEVFANVFNLFDEHAFTVNQTFNQTLSPFNISPQQKPLLTSGAPNPEFGVSGQGFQGARYYELGARIRF